MRLVPLQDFSRSAFGNGSAPHANTLRRWVRERELPGLQLGARYYVDEAALEAGYQRPSAALTFEVTTDEDAIVAKVLSDVRRAP